MPPKRKYEAGRATSAEAKARTNAYRRMWAFQMNQGKHVEKESIEYSDKEHEEVFTTDSEENPKEDSQESQESNKNDETEIQTPIVDDEVELLEIEHKPINMKLSGPKLDDSSSDDDVNLAN